MGRVGGPESGQPAFSAIAASSTRRPVMIVSIPARRSSSVGFLASSTASSWIPGNSSAGSSPPVSPPFALVSEKPAISLSAKPRR
jgi:hypothetical protein